MHASSATKATIDETKFKRILARAISVPLILMTALALILVLQINQLLQAAQWVEHTDMVLTQAHGTQKLLIDLETGQRGYLISMNPVFLEPYNKALAVIDSSFAVLLKQVADNPEQARRVEEMHATYGQWIDNARFEIALRQRSENYQAAFDTARGKKLMDTMRGQFAAFVATEETLRTSRSRHTEQTVRNVLLSSLGSSLLLGGLLAFLSQGNIRALSRSYQSALATVQEQSDEIKKSEEWLSTTLRSIGDAMIATDANGKIVLMNMVAEQLTGWRQAEAQGKYITTVFNIINEASREQVVSPVERVMRDGVIVGLANHTILIAKDGREIPIDDSSAPMRDGKGKLTGVVLVFRDITERHRAEAEILQAKEAAEEANHAKSLFVANMSHELRTPLNAVIGYSEMLQEEATEQGLADFIPDLEKINGAGRHLLSLINDVLDLSKIEAGKMELFLEAFDVGPVVEEVITTARPLADKNHNRLEVRCPPDVGVMRADLTKLRQSLFNLLSNASKFTQDGVITLEVARSVQNGRDEITFAVRDTGIGMTEEQVGHLFQVFRQADASTTRKFGGTGLGLAITRHFCEMMDGSVDVASEPGKGSTFTLRLPALVADPKDAPAPDDPAETESPLARENIVLVIDDDTAARDLMARFLRKEGYRVELAGSGEEGLRLARTLRPTTITLDVMMPSMDGWAVLSALKADPITTDIPVIMLTMVDNKSLGFALGAADYMTKPVNRERLSSILKRHACITPPCRVLLVEDDTVTRQMMRAMLEREGWEVAEAENGQVGLTRLTEQTPQLILLDLMMPEMDGFEFAARLHQNPDWRKVPIVVLTAKDITEEDRRRLNGYVGNIVQKGMVSREALLDQVRDLVATCAAP